MDRYTIRARLQAALLVVLPLGVATIALVPGGIAGWSAISHGDKLLGSDLTSWRAGLTPGAVHEFMDERALQHIVQVILVNWLLMRAVEA